MKRRRQEVQWKREEEGTEEVKCKHNCTHNKCYTHEFFCLKKLDYYVPNGKCTEELEMTRTRG